MIQIIKKEDNICLELPFFGTEKYLSSKSNIMIGSIFYRGREMGTLHCHVYHLKRNVEDEYFLSKSEIWVI
mgnify:CR=1 FL=1